MFRLATVEQASSFLRCLLSHSWVVTRSLSSCLQYNIFVVLAGWGPSKSQGPVWLVGGAGLDKGWC